MENLGPLETEILGILWKRGPLPTGEIRKELEKRGKKLAATTVSTTLSRMHRKKLLSRQIGASRRGVTYIYKAAVRPEDLAKTTAKTLIEKLGSTALLAFIREGARNLSPEQLEKLRREIEELSKRRRKNAHNH